MFIFIIWVSSILFAFESNHSYIYEKNKRTNVLQRHYTLLRSVKPKRTEYIDLYGLGSGIYGVPYVF